MSNPNRFVLKVSNSSRTMIFPAPKRGLNYIVSTNVDSGRNANGEVVGQVVGRDIYKLDQMEWAWLPAPVWEAMLQMFSEFFVNVTFWDFVNGRWITLKMYPGDRSAEPYWLDYGNDTPLYYTNCKLNLIDCGINGDIGTDYTPGTPTGSPYKPKGQGGGTGGDTPDPDEGRRDDDIWDLIPY